MTSMIRVRSADEHSVGLVDRAQGLSSLAAS